MLQILTTWNASMTTREPIVMKNYHGWRVRIGITMVGECVSATYVMRSEDNTTIECRIWRSHVMEETSAETPRAPRQGQSCAVQYAAVCFLACAL